MKGVYAVLFRLKESKSIKIGALGEITFDRGLYLYTGSGRSNVVKRIERHFSESKNNHWHIDYFSQHADPEDYFILPEKSSFECVLADITGAIGEPVKDFGASDCGCESHFFKL